MKMTALLTVALLSLTVAGGTALASSKKGEALFKQKCAVCHPNGGNIMNPKLTLRGMRNPKLIIDKIRKGGGGMTAFDRKAISDAEAKEIAAYIIKTFTK